MEFNKSIGYSCKQQHNIVCFHNRSYHNANQSITEMLKFVHLVGQPHKLIEKLYKSSPVPN